MQEFLILLTIVCTARISDRGTWRVWSRKRAAFFF